MCKYCENLKTCMSDLEFGHGIESENSRSVFARVARNPENNKYFFHFDEDYSACFEIEFCPKCGRKLIN